MPIFRINDKLHYFAHVPKCGGTSVEAYLSDRFGRLGFHEPGRHLIAVDQRWGKGSAEHIPVACLDRIIPSDWLATSFAVVRHPVRRLISAFCFARDVRQRFPLSTDINTWFQEASSWIGKDPFQHSAHFAPQSILVPNGTRIFRLEDGLDQIVPYLDALAGNTDGPREILAKNVGKWRADAAPPNLTQNTLGLIAEVYAVDFARFGYDAPVSIEAAKILPDLPSLTATGKPPVPSRRPFLQRLYRGLQKKMEQ